MDEDTFSSPPPVPFRAPSRAASHHRRNSSMGAVPSSLFEPFSPVVDDHDIGSDNAEEEPFSTFDPRRFTPTLHANLVSEILSLRRELESKNKEIGKLETSLDESQNENELLNDDMTKVTKENRSLKKQMSLLEGGTLSAITEIARERDEAVENIADVRKRLEQAQKKLKSKEDEVDRSQSLWERDRENWDTERRNWERKVHVVENRLKTILHEVAAAQAAGNLQKLNDADEDATKDNSTTLDSASVRSSSAFDRRRTSASSASTYDGEPFNSGRFSSMSFANANGVKGNGFNLADELALDEDEEDYMDLVDEIPEMRPLSVASQSSLNTALKARKILGLSMDGNVAIGARDLINLDESAPTTNVTEVKRQPEYRDVGIQFTPPPSPLLPASGTEVVKEPESEPEIIPTEAPEMKDTAVETVAVEMFSTSCQTDDVLISVAAPELVTVDAQLPAEPAKIPTVSASTQTDAISEEDKSTQSSTAEESQPTTVSSPTVPTIAIIPPGSEPATPRTSLVLPPHTKSIACQTEYDQSYDMRSVGMQTEAIQIDQRPVKLPASLLPSAILDKADKVDAEPISMPFISPPPRSPHRPLNRTFDSKAKDKKAKTQPELVQAYPGNNDNGPLAEDDTSDIRRPFRSSSLFAGFDTNDDELPEILPELPDVFSDDDLFNRPMASYTLRSGRMVNRSGLDNDTVREEDEFDIDLPSTVQGGDNAGRKTLHSKGSTGSKQPDIRRATLITNGAAAHQRNRPRSPSDPSIDSASTGAARPPFPVPVRLSSRNVPTTNSDSNQSPTPYSDGNSSRGRGSRRITRQPTLRKVRSATAMQKNQQERAGSRSPPPMSASGMSGMSNSSYAPDSPQLPPLPPIPTDEAVIYRPKRTARRVSSSRPGSIRSQAQSYSIEEPASDHVQSTNVVDAIAQTMVGEWMFKYVRRRKSFGMSDHKDTIDPGKSTEEVSASITSTGVRHKRWVWLAPYERAVMWSSKQPTSGPALLGKNGRKLIIQSVLDVKDDTPLPKGSNVTAPFNRSILILTPQRALKFTAMSIERHYVWLTALSFLSHTSIGMGELPAIPPPIPQEEYNARPPAASLRRNPIRDSIRVAKGRPRPQPSKRSFTDNSTLNPEYSGTGFDLEPIMDAADPPTIPRYAGHTRKRSNTAPKAPLTAAFRSFSSHPTLPSNYSAITAASSDIYATSSIGGITSGMMSGRSSVSRRTSEASGPSSIANGNLYDPMGTVRMEAFIDRVEHPRSRTTNLVNHNQRNRVPRKVDNVQWNAGNSFDLARSEDGSEIHYRNDELFRGF